MKTERAFFLGLLLGVAGSLIPDIPSAIDIMQDRPERREVLIIVYGLFGIAALWCLLEVAAK